MTVHWGPSSFFPACTTIPCASNRLRFIAAFTVPESNRCRFMVTCGGSEVEGAKRKENKDMGPGGAFQAFGDQLLDYIEAGPKMRKWYGAPEQQLPGERDLAREQELQKQEVAEEDDEEEGAGKRVLVVDAESETGMLVVLSLILARAKIRVLVKDVRAATDAFGPYVEAVMGHPNDVLSVDCALKGVNSIILPAAAVGVVPERAKAKAVKHIVLLSEAIDVQQQQGLVGKLLNGGKAKRTAERESAVLASGVPCTILRAPPLEDAPGGSGFSVSEPSTLQGRGKNQSMTREDAARACVLALQRPIPESPPAAAVVLDVANGSADDESFISQLESIARKTVLGAEA
eukprot:TRINITY_DN17323_c0_g1_i1.p1 TRINITY_DN17323_c0_g1~~TRINITY_DN17323_c0_g1_i1.p1  ORF type:complete len:346 (+),score=105.12 TRINITY_DN17323_c0_g1_i1:160-1197(+)